MLVAGKIAGVLAAEVQRFFQVGLHGGEIVLRAGLRPGLAGFLPDRVGRFGRWARAIVFRGLVFRHLPDAEPELRHGVAVVERKAGDIGHGSLL